MSPIYSTPTKTASVPFVPTGVYRARVVNVNGSLVDIEIPRLTGDLLHTNIEVIGAPNTPMLAPRDLCYVAFVEGYPDELVVLGNVRLPSNVGGGGEFNGALITIGPETLTLTSTVTSTIAPFVLPNLSTTLSLTEGETIHLSMGLDMISLDQDGNVVIELQVNGVAYGVKALFHGYDDSEDRTILSQGWTYTASSAGDYTFALVGSTVASPQGSPVDGMASINAPNSRFSYWGTTPFTINASDPATSTYPGPPGPEGSGYYVTSTSTITMGGGSKTFVVDSPQAYFAGMPNVRVVNPATSNWMIGDITAVTATSITIYVSAATSGATYSSWVFNVSGYDAVTRETAYLPASGAQTVALDVYSQNNIHIVTGHANGTAITFTVANATNSQPFIVSVLQGSTTLSTISSWFATVRWAGGVVPTLTATLNKRDTFGFIRTGANTYDGFVIGQNC